MWNESVSLGFLNILSAAVPTSILSLPPAFRCYNLKIKKKKGGGWFGEDVRFVQFLWGEHNLCKSLEIKGISVFSVPYSTVMWKGLSWGADVLLCHWVKPSPDRSMARGSLSVRQETLSDQPEIPVFWWIPCHLTVFGACVEKLKWKGKRTVASMFQVLCLD